MSVNMMNYTKEQIERLILSGESAEIDVAAIRSLHLPKNEEIELIELRDFVLKIDAEKSALSQQTHSEKAMRLSEYVVSDVRNLQSAEAEDSLLSRISDAFWVWMIEKFNLAHYEEHIEKEKIQFSFRPVIRFALSGALIFMVAVTLLEFISTERTSISDSDKKVRKFERTFIAAYSKERLFKYSNSIQVAMAAQAHFRKASDTKMELHKGSVWLDVEKDGAGFEVSTVFGNIHVTGTSFAVSIDNDKALFEVSEGTIVIERDGLLRVLLNAGQSIVADSSGLSEISERDLGMKRPLWVINLERTNWTDHNPDLVAYWDFNDPSETPWILDSSENGLHAQIKRPVDGSLQQPSQKEELFGQSMLMDPANPMLVEIDEAATLNNLQNNFTVMAWINPRSFDGSRRILSSSGRGWRLGIVDGWLTLSTIWQDGIGSPNQYYKIRISNKSLSLNKWSHIACSVDRAIGKVSFYINGKFIQDVNITMPVYNGNTSWYIGQGISEKPGISTFDGNLDELRVYSRALSENEIMQVSKIDILKYMEE